VRCTEDELPPPDGSPDDGPLPDLDAGVADGGEDAGDAGDGGAVDAGPPKPTCTKTLRGCDGYDDYAVATRGLAPGSIWVTRMRASLPVSALTQDLRLEAASPQAEQNPQLHTEEFTDPNFDPCNPTASTSASPSSSSSSDDGCGCRTTGGRHVSAWLVAMGGAIALMLGRRRRWRS
jgi:MYXO-CTERM domain-containing protein